MTCIIYHSMDIIHNKTQYISYIIVYIIHIIVSSTGTVHNTIPHSSQYYIIITIVYTIKTIKCQALYPTKSLRIATMPFKLFNQSLQYKYTINHINSIYKPNNHLKINPSINTTIHIYKLIYIISRIISHYITN